VYRLDGVRAPRPEIVVDRRQSLRHSAVNTITTRNAASLMLRVHRGVRVTGPEPTLLRLAQLLGDEDFEIACEDARRSGLTSVPALRAYVGRFGFVREHPLTWEQRKYRFDFAFERSRVILETNGRRWHDDPTDYERDNEKWSVPGHHGYKLVLATWDKVVRRPGRLIEELRATLAA
jgi:very-short-patch-repair endonuclease